jgi:hypothetical protein
MSNSTCGIIASICSLGIGGVPFSQVIVLISSPLTLTCAVGFIFKYCFYNHNYPAISNAVIEPC